MVLFVNNLNSFDLYTKYPPGSVLETDVFEDVCSGMNPCYYMINSERLKVSTSVASLIIDSGTFEVNNDFNPAKFFLHPWQRNTVDFLRKIINSTEKKLRNTLIIKNPAIKKLKSAAPKNAKALLWDPHYSAHLSCETIDKRIKKARPFESITENHNKIKISLDPSINSLDEYLEKSVYYLCKSINDIEKSFPHKRHVILMGGKDSQLISLIPKINDTNWYIFSAEPNYTLIKEWITKNDIPVIKIFAHDGRNEERMGDFKKKVICSDLYTNLIHVRYAPTLQKIAQDFDNECIFWLGSMPRRASLYDGSYRNPEALIKTEEFFNVHLNTFPGWQGNIQQTYSNYIGCPFISPYYLKEMWHELYAHLNPSIIPNGQDLRARLGEMLIGRKIHWPTENPGPTPYQYWYLWFNSYRYYTGYIRRNLK